MVSSFDDATTGVLSQIGTSSAEGLNESAMTKLTGASVSASETYLAELKKWKRVSLALKEKVDTGHKAKDISSNFCNSDRIAIAHETMS